MPQFPFQPSASKSDDAQAPDSNIQAIDDVSNGAARLPKEPLKFKSVEPKGPVTRVRIKGASSESRPSTKVASPFKDSGMLEDVDSIMKFRDDFGKPFALTVVVLGIVALTYWLSQPVDKTAEIQSRINPLLLQADELENESPATLQKRLDLFKKRSGLADQLLAFEDQSVALDRGAELKLKTLVSWDTLNLENNIDDSEVTTNLENTAREFINSRNRTVANNAKVGLSLIRIRGYIENPQPNYFPEILGQFKLVSEFAKNDLASANNLMSIAKHFRSRNLTDEANQLFRAINLACAASHNSKIADVGAEAGQFVASSKSLFNELKGMVADKGEVSIDPIREKIAENITQDSVSTGKLESIIDFLNFLVEKRAVPAAKSLLSDVSQSIYLIAAGIERDSIKKKFDDLSKRVQSVGKTFNYDGLFSVEGRPISRGSLKRQNKLLVFWSPENQKSIDLIKEISTKHRIFAARRVQVVAVANVNESNERQVVELSNNTRGIEFLTLQEGNVDSQAFVTRMPVPKLPYWVLLDQQDRVYAINIEIKDL